MSNKSDYMKLSDLLSAAVDTGNRDWADEVYASAMASKTISEDELAELFADYNAAVEAGEV